MYLKGKGVPQNYPKAALWFRKVAEQGDVEAQLQIARMYKNGIGVKQDLDKAHKWYTTAWKNKDSDAISQKQAELNRQIIKLSKVEAESKNMTEEAYSKMIGGPPCPML